MHAPSPIRCALALSLIGHGTLLLFLRRVHLMFFDESFHDSLEESSVSLGSLCGVGIPEDQMSQLVEAVPTQRGIGS